MISNRFDNSCAKRRGWRWGVGSVGGRGRALSIYKRPRPSVYMDNGVKTLSRRFRRKEKTALAGDQNPSSVLCELVDLPHSKPPPPVSSLSLQRNAFCNPDVAVKRHFLPLPPSPSCDLFTTNIIREIKKFRKTYRTLFTKFSHRIWFICHHFAAQGEFTNMGLYMRLQKL